MLKTIEERRLWEEGKELWFEYVMVNGYSAAYNNHGILKLSKLLDLNKPYILKRLKLS